jgi:hypothetical protein
MLKPFPSFTKKNPFGTKTINKNSLINNDLTGSLLRIQEPEIQRPNQDRNRIIIPKTINRADIETDLTGSLSRIEEPATKEIVEYRPNSIGVKTNNTKRKILDNRKSIFQYSARQIEKQITGFDETQNKLYVVNTILDYGTESVSSDNFELFYNGATVPFIYRVEQVGTTIEITFLEEYINYESLTLAQIFVVGKFK